MNVGITIINHCFFDRFHQWRSLSLIFLFIVENDFCTSMPHCIRLIFSKPRLALFETRYVIWNELAIKKLPVPLVNRGIAANPKALVVGIDSIGHEDVVQVGMDRIVVIDGQPSSINLTGSQGLVPILSYVWRILLNQPILVNHLDVSCWVRHG